MPTLNRNGPSRGPFGLDGQVRTQKKTSGQPLGPLAPVQLAFLFKLLHGIGHVVSIMSSTCEVCFGGYRWKDIFQRPLSRTIVAEILPPLAAPAVHS